MVETKERRKKKLCLKEALERKKGVKGKKQRNKETIKDAV